MSEEQAQPPDNTPNETPPPPPLINNAADAVEKKNNPPQEQYGSADIQRKSPNRKAVKWLSENWDKVINIIITALLAYYTFLLFRTAADQGRDAKRVTDIADSTLKVTVKTVEEGRIRDSTNAIENRNRFKLDSQSTRSQIQSAQSQTKSLKDAADRFTAENQSFILFEIVQVVPLTINEPIQISYKLRNLRNNPIEVISKKNQTQILKDNTVIATTLWDEFKPIIDNSNASNWDITKESASNGVCYGLSPITQEDVDKIKNRGYYIYTYGEIKYHDLVTDKIRYYRYIIKCKPAGFQDYIKYLYNENRDQKN